MEKAICSISESWKKAYIENVEDEGPNGMRGGNRQQV